MLTNIYKQLLANKYLLEIKWIIWAGLFSALSPIFMKYYVTTESLYILFLVALSECGIMYGYYQIFQEGDFINKFAIVKILALLFIILPGIVFFHSHFNWHTFFGLLCAFATIYLLN
jgi:multidrug transporter EmrE-like cation transporter